MKPIRVMAPSASRYALQAALLVYDDGHEAYVSSHPIVRSSHGATLGAGHPLERQELLRLLERAGRDLGVAGWIAPEILFLGPDVMAWWRPASPASVFFKAGAIAKGASRGSSPQPALVFAVTGRRWYVWAVKGDARPRGETRLYQAPYLNVYENGGICEGDVRLPKQLAPETARDFERAFFESRFTHTNAARLCDYEGGPEALWRDLLAGRHGTFPEAAMVPTDQTLADAMKAIARQED